MPAITQEAKPIRTFKIGENEFRLEREEGNDGAIGLRVGGSGELLLIFEECGFVRDHTGTLGFLRSEGAEYTYYERPLQTRIEAGPGPICAMEVIGRRYVHKLTGMQ